MTSTESKLAGEVDQAQEANEKDTTSIQNGYATTTDHGNKKSQWMSSKPPVVVSSANTATKLKNKGNTNQQEMSKQLNYFNIQKNAYFKGGYPDARAYYGWGLNPMRFPALIYPHSFLGFTPTVAWMKTNDSTAEQASNIEKIDKWKDRKDRSSSAEVSTRETSALVYGEDKVKLETSKSIHSEDEGLVLDERETMKRSHEKIQTLKAQSERSSVIQENISIQAKPSVITLAQDSTKSTDQEQQNKPAKRGRASTRQIEKTDQYWDRRKKNNVSAKKSRDARRQREAMTNQRSAMLETENLRLRAELATLKDENIRLKQQLKSMNGT